MSSPAIAQIAQGPTHVSWLDLVIVVVVVLAVLGGWRSGRLSHAAASVGHLLGALAGFTLAKTWVLPKITSPAPAWIILGALTIGGALAGGALGHGLIRSGRVGPSASVGVVAGALSGLVALSACWAAVQVAADLDPAATGARQSSAVVTTLDRADPAASAALDGALVRTDAPSVGHAGSGR